MISIARLVAAGVVGLALAAPQAATSLDPASFDARVRPQDDAFAYVNGRWLAGTEIPADRVSYTAFLELADRAERDVRNAIEAAQRQPKRTGAAQQVVDLYASMLDQARVEALGAAPLRPALARIDEVTSLKAMATEAGRLTAVGLGGPFMEDRKSTR